MRTTRAGEPSMREGLAVLPLQLVHFVFEMLGPRLQVGALLGKFGDGLNGDFHVVGGRPLANELLSLCDPVIHGAVLIKWASIRPSFRTTNLIAGHAVHLLRQFLDLARLTTFS